jgi:hypothetical protein
MADREASVRIVGADAFASTAGRKACAKNARVAAFVGITSEGVCA